MQSHKREFVAGDIVRWPKGIFEFHKFTDDGSKTGRTELMWLGIVVQHETGLLVEVAANSPNKTYRELGEDLEYIGSNKDLVIV